MLRSHQPTELIFVFVYINCTSIQANFKKITNLNRATAGQTDTIDPKLLYFQTVDRSEVIHSESARWTVL